MQPMPRSQRTCQAIWNACLHQPQIGMSNSPSLNTGIHLTLKPLMWKIWWTPNNDNRWQMGFNWAFRGLNDSALSISQLVSAHIQ
jgi:hypothetical protein